MYRSRQSCWISSIFCRFCCPESRHNYSRDESSISLKYSQFSGNPRNLCKVLGRFVHASPSRLQAALLLGWQSPVSWEGCGFDVDRRSCRSAQRIWMHQLVRQAKRVVVTECIRTIRTGEARSVGMAVARSMTWSNVAQSVGVAVQHRSVRAGRVEDITLLLVGYGTIIRLARTIVNSVTVVKNSQNLRNWASYRRVISVVMHGFCTARVMTWVRKTHGVHESLKPNIMLWPVQCSLQNKQQIKNNFIATVQKMKLNHPELCWMGSGCNSNQIMLTKETVCDLVETIISSEAPGRTEAANPILTVPLHGERLKYSSWLL